MSAKKRGPGRPPKNKKAAAARAKAAAAPTHTVPSGFWGQVGAIFVMIISVLILVGMSGWGGEVPAAVAKFVRYAMGWMGYLFPLLMIYLAAQAFRDESKRPSPVVIITAILFCIILAATFQLMLVKPFEMSRADPVDGGGLIGWLVADFTLGFVNVPVAAIIYVVMLLVLAMFVFSVSPKAVFETIKNMFGTESDTNAEANAKVARNLAAKEAAEQKKAPEVSGLTDDTDVDKEKTPRGLARLRRKKTEENDVPETEKPKETKLTHDVDVSKTAEVVTAAAPVTPTPVINNANWKFPDIKLLSKKRGDPDPGDFKRNIQIIEDTLQQFNINGTVEKVNIGPRVTQYCLRPQRGIKLSRISELQDNLLANLKATSIRMETPIPGQPYVGIEIPNKRSAFVGIRQILETEAWQKSKAPLTFAVGLNVTGNPIVMDLASLPHLLIAGTTGSGKSVMMNAIVVSLLYRNTPDDLKFVLVDPKGNEMVQYKDMPHLLAPIVGGTGAEAMHKLAKTLIWLADEMERRYKLFAERGGVKKLKDFNKRFPDEKIPNIVLIIDEYTDLIDSLKSTERETVQTVVQRIAQKGRAAGIHEIIMMQAPRAKYIQGPLKANVPAGFAFAVRSKMESQQIINASGAEALMGKGDMLMVTNEIKEPRRVQAVNVEDEEIDRIVADLRIQSPAQYNEDLMAKLSETSSAGGMTGEFSMGQDEDYNRAVQVVINEGKASTSLLQRRMRIGYGKASRIMDELEEHGVIGPSDGSKARQVLIQSLDELN